MWNHITICRVSRTAHFCGEAEHLQRPLHSSFEGKVSLDEGSLTVATDTCVLSDLSQAAFSAKSSRFPAGHNVATADWSVCCYA